MYRCNDCGADFHEPKITHDMIPYGNGYVQGRPHEVCPFCDGGFEQTQVCELCGSSFTESKHAGVCQSCINIIEKRFSETLNEKFTPFEISVLNTIYDGRDLE